MEKGAYAPFLFNFSKTGAPNALKAYCFKPSLVDTAIVVIPANNIIYLIFDSSSAIRAACSLIASTKKGIIPW